MAYTFRDIKAWQRAHGVVLEIYKITKGFPAEEKFGLTAQLRRSAASVATNIVEGYKRRSDRDFAHFLKIADASLEETKYHLLLAHDLTYVARDAYVKLSTLADEVGRMLCGFRKTLGRP